MNTDLKKAALLRPGVRAEYEALSSEFELLRQMLAARTKAGMSQADVALRMGAHAPAITRLESALGRANILRPLIRSNDMRRQLVVSFKSGLFAVPCPKKRLSRLAYSGSGAGSPTS